MTQSDNSSDRLAELARENEALRERYEQALTEIDLLKRDVEVLHDIGIYNYRHPLENAVAYQMRWRRSKQRSKRTYPRAARSKRPRVSRLITRWPKAGR